MIIVMDRYADDEDIEKVRRKIEESGFISHLSRGEERVIIGVIGDNRVHDFYERFKNMDAVEDVIPIMRPMKFVTREYQDEDTIIEVGNVKIGGEDVVVIAGPCAVERRDHVLLTAMTIKEAGAKVLRGGVFRSRSRPEDFPGLGREGLEILKEARMETGLLVITEVQSPREMELIYDYADILQVGARFMNNYELLSAVAGSGKPILLKRGMMSTLEEFLVSAEFIMKKGNSRIILCERGIRTFEKWTSYTLDLSAIPVLKSITHLPVMADPSHGTGHARYVPAMAKAALAAGADGLIIEVHPNPKTALSDGIQSLEPQAFKELMEELKLIARAIDRNI